ncbi:phenylalanine 4-monooxygenase [Wenzhouxiangella marina]|uniref:phenylalanine 4-monooxygenase n=1 Tax=Wenzhouxiangella marina TaxID=1579979 RepID=A0A0K0XWT8_9GAMM|nr:phenylalanine 4-monooxygenase [Wenzhouxiangella marina]AKS42135.1 phenylalanine 4-monooxygenase [Wenzhouxiangella marina]MBB6086093.1 phenylalanine-4-hydroxylase [Wenzhouxiangella marina]
MGKSTKYEAKVPDENGVIPYSAEEDSVWADLYSRQMDIIEGRVCQEFLDGLDMLQLPTDRIPQPKEVSAVLHERTGWQVEPVPALINFDRFFKLLAERKFPAASFIRSRQEMDYLQEPDIFHEIFGHTTMLTHQAFADFTEAYGKAGVKASHKERVFLARLYWFTVEFGLLQTPSGVRIYGGGIASSPGETIYALESDEPLRRPFDPIEALRTPYRIDIYQPVYFILDRMNDLFELSSADLLGLIREARALGQFEPTFPPKQKEAA